MVLAVVLGFFIRRGASSVSWIGVVSCSLVSIFRAAANSVTESVSSNISRANPRYCSISGDSAICSSLSMVNRCRPLIASVLVGTGFLTILRLVTDSITFR